MRILLALAVVAVFVAMMVLDTTALLRLTFICVTGGCGVPFLWIATGGAVVALAALFSLRRPVASAKKASVRKTVRPRPAGGKTVARKKPKPAK